jgi:hypothetical protein
MDGGDRSRQEHAIESNATTRVVYGQSNCRVRTFVGGKRYAQRTLRAVHQPLPISSDRLAKADFFMRKGGTRWISYPELRLV